MSKIIIYSKPGCPYCKKAKNALQHLKLPYKEISLNPEDADYINRRDALFQYYNHNSYPIIIIGDKVVGGYTELVNAYETLKLHKMCRDIGLYLSIDF